MKKIIFLFSLVFLSSCGCILSQIPPQKIYAGAGCTAVLPNYLTKITATDNCEIASFTQVPAPGFQLTPTNKTTNVTIKATDGSGNFKQIVFTVTLLDTVKPVLNIDPSLLAENWKTVDKMYDLADAYLKEIAYFDAILPIDSLFIPDPVGNSYITGLTRVRYTKNNVSWLVDKFGHGSWITSADGVTVPDTTGKSVIVQITPHGKRLYSFK